MISQLCERSKKEGRRKVGRRGGTGDKSCVMLTGKRGVTGGPGFKRSRRANACWCKVAEPGEDV